MNCLLTEDGEQLLAENGDCIELWIASGGKYDGRMALAEWEARHRWHKRAERLLDDPEPKVVDKAVQDAADDILPRVFEPVESLAELVADARLLRLDEARALESAMAVKDVLAIAELAYLAELAVQQEKDAIAAFLMLMD